MNSEQSSTEPSQPYGSARDLPSFVEMSQQVKLYKGVTRFVMRDKRAEAVELEAELNKMADRVDAFYELLGPRHWTFNDWMSVTKVDEILDENLSPELAEARLIELYRNQEATKFHALRLRNVDGLRERHHMIVRAREDYDADRFDSCVLLLIAVIDGFVNDFESGKRKGLAAREAEEMVAWDSVTGHHLGLTNALKPFLRTFKKRVDEEVFEVHRHGIVHGSVVNFNNVVVATKAWNLLHAVVDWSKASTKQIEEEMKPAEPGLRELFVRVAEQGRRRKIAEEFEPWIVASSDPGFSNDEVHLACIVFFDAWQKKQWGRIVSIVPLQLIGARRKGQAAQLVKSWFDLPEISDFEIDRIEYTAFGVAEVRGSATIGDTSGLLRIRWVCCDDQDNLTLNHENGVWRLAVIASRTYLVDEKGNRLI